MAYLTKLMSDGSIANISYTGEKDGTIAINITQNIGDLDNNIQAVDRYLDLIITDTSNSISTTIRIYQKAIPKGDFIFYIDDIPYSSPNNQYWYGWILLENCPSINGEKILKIDDSTGYLSHIDGRILIDSSYNRIRAQDIVTKGYYRLY